MLNKIITSKKDQWLNSHDCSIRFLIDYIRASGGLRETQVEAIEQYLFLKIKGDNKPLSQLFAEGYFITGSVDLSKENINQTARDFLTNNISALALFEFARMKANGSTLLPELEKLIIEQAGNLNYDRIIKSIFYNVNYADYLFSLPMGAGKTYLMAAFIYLDLYFALLEPENKNFAHNFLVLVPSGLKSSIVPSLKTIENFDPSWVIPEPAATNLKKILKFEVLDQPKTGKKSNKARNPNAQKVNQYLTQQDLTGLVLVVNAEKVILDRIDLVKVGETVKVEFHETDDDKDKFANELRNLIGKIPNLEILIDEVHHAATDEVKLRQVVNKWNTAGNVTTVLGFSGTPYLSSPDNIELTEKSFLRFSQITNTVYYYPLLTGIKSFLKKPTVKVAENLDPLKIIKKGVEDFYNEYKNTKYANGSIAKLAIYCGKIERLENEIYPALTKLISKYGDNESNILKYHKGNKTFKIPRENETEYVSLDQPFSKKRIILLVQVGKEGWDCRSLTGVILSQQGDCPSNMVLQTSCRCLRQVDKDKTETALIWLNEHNAKILNKQLKEEQHTSIEEINRLGKENEAEKIERFSRMAFLELPIVEFYQMKVQYKTMVVEDNPNTSTKLNDLLTHIDSYKAAALIRTQKNFSDNTGSLVITEEGVEVALYESWLMQIAKESFNTISFAALEQQGPTLEKIFSKITYIKNSIPVFNELYDLNAIKAQVRLSFNQRRKLETAEETIPHKAELLIAENLTPFLKNEKFYPSVDDSQKILELDKNNLGVEIDETEIKKFYEQLKKSPLGAMAPPYEQFKSQYDFSLAVKSKDKSFHYLPYNFWQSNFEKNIHQEILKLDEFKKQGLEVYYNGERGLTGFVINCFAKETKYWRSIGRYTPDFLIIKRKKKEMHKVLIIETKGSGFENDKVFQKKKNYVSNDFLKLNEEKFGYKRFDFLYLKDSDALASNLSSIQSKLKDFFTN